ncbi:MAG: HD domain-containing protein [Hyphomicrobiales bacterium]|nr:HD domain-containing protein [Hyphomicrobiales bacterium]
MHDITIIADTVERVRALRSRLSPVLDADYRPIAELLQSKPGALTVVDIDLREPAQVHSVKAWLETRPRDSQVIVSADQTSHAESTQAYAMGATCLMPRPIDGRWVSRLAFNGRTGMAAPLPSLTDAGEAALPDARALRDIFAAAAAGEAPALGAVRDASAEIVEAVEREGLSQWLALIRSHHSQTYRHCLTVTALAVAFGRRLGFSRHDSEKMAAAGLLHDVGKAAIPIEILEKPAPLIAGERAVMRTHPERGHDVLKQMPDLHPEMLDMVLHHHEYLDGSGYPHGLRGAQISDLVRLITIADVYAALIERRSYKEPLSGREALAVLEGMGPKLDRALVREFAPLVRDLA